MISIQPGGTSATPTPSIVLIQITMPRKKKNPSGTCPHCGNHFQQLLRHFSNDHTDCAITRQDPSHVARIFQSSYNNNTSKHQIPHGYHWQHPPMDQNELRSYYLTDPDLPLLSQQHQHNRHHVVIGDSRSIVNVDEDHDCCPPAAGDEDNNHILLQGTSSQEETHECNPPSSQHYTTFTGQMPTYSLYSSNNQSNTTNTRKKSSNNFHHQESNKRQRLTKEDEYYDINVTDIHMPSQRISHKELEELSSENGGALFTFAPDMLQQLEVSTSDICSIGDDHSEDSTKTAHHSSFQCTTTEVHEYTPQVLVKEMRNGHRGNQAWQQRSDVRNERNQHDADISHTTQHLLTERQTPQQCSQISPSSSCKYDFREYFQHIYSFANMQVTLSIPLQCSIDLLHLMNESNISNNQYSNIVKWYEDTSIAMSKVMNPDSSAKFYMNSMNIPKDRNKVIKEISSILTNNKDDLSLIPTEKVIRALSNNKLYTSISRFPMKGILFSYFLNSYLMSSRNSWVYDKYYRNPNLIPRETGDQRFYGDIHTGTWFLKAYNNVCPFLSDILVPIIIFIDETTIDNNGRQSLDAVLLTLGLFRRSTRNKQEAWRLLGYVPDCTSTEVGTEDLPEKPEDKRKDYHHYLQYMLQEVYELEMSDGIIWDLPSLDGKSIEQVRFRFRVMFVSGDAPGLDKLADMYATYSSSSSYLCRDCHCPTEKLDDPEIVCNFIERDEIRTKSKEQLKNMCFYKIENNAFNRHDFGGDSGGINGCSPPEILHQFLLGVVQTQLNFFSNAITRPAMLFIDDMIKNTSSNFHRQSNRSYPDISLFKNGFQKSSLTGKEHIDQLFVLYLALIQTHSLYSLPKIEKNVPARYKTVTKKKRKAESTNTDISGQTETYIREKLEYRKILSEEQSMKDWITMLEHTLCFNEWINLEKIPYEHLEQEGSDAQNSSTDCLGTRAIRKYLRKYKHNVTEVAGNKLRKAKIHWTLHLPHYGRKFGSLLNQNGGIGERMLKSLVKECARKTQRRQHLLAKQACDRYYESNVIQTIYSIIHGPKPCFSSSYTTKQSVSSNNRGLSETNLTPAGPNTNDLVSHNQVFSKSRMYEVGGRYDIIFDTDLSTYLATFWSNTRKKATTTHSEETIKMIMKRLRHVDIGIKSSVIKAFSTLKFQCDWSIGTPQQEDAEILDDSKVIFRANPCFYKKPWFDWCITVWKTGGVGDDNNDDNQDHQEEDDEDEEGLEYFPSRIIMFIDANSMEFEDKEKVIREKGKLWAVVKSTQKDPRSNAHEHNQGITNRTSRINQRPNDFCKLVETYQMEESLRIISVNAIKKDAFVITDVDTVYRSNPNQRNYFGCSSLFSGKNVLLIKDRNQWANEFINGNW